MKKERFDPYSNYYYKANKKKNRRAKFLSILFVLISISIVVFFSISFSKFLTISKIVNVNSNYIVENKTLYAISLHTCNNVIDAEEKSENIKKQGGAGYILNYGVNEFKILTSVYENEKDAKSVKFNLENSGQVVEIVRLELPALDFKINLNAKSSDILNKAINLFYSSYKTLYNLSVNYDSKQTDYTALKNSLASLYSDNQNIVKNFKENFKTSSNIYILYVNIYLERANDIIKNLQNTDESQNISSKIKYSYFDILNCYLSLNNEMI